MRKPYLSSDPCKQIGISISTESEFVVIFHRNRRRIIGQIPCVAFLINIIQTLSHFLRKKMIFFQWSKHFQALLTFKVNIVAVPTDFWRQEEKPIDHSLEHFCWVDSSGGEYPIWVVDGDYPLDFHSKLDGEEIKSDHFDTFLRVQSHSLHCSPYNNQWWRD